MPIQGHGNLQTLFEDSERHILQEYHWCNTPEVVSGLLFLYTSYKKLYHNIPANSCSWTHHQCFHTHKYFAPFFLNTPDLHENLAQVFDTFHRNSFSNYRDRVPYHVEKASVSHYKIYKPNRQINR